MAVDDTAQLTFSHLGASCDFFPLGDIRLTGGALPGIRKLEGNGLTTGGNVANKGTAYPAAAGAGVTISDSFPSAAPNLGIGIGIGHGQPERGLGFCFDAGTAFGARDVGLSATPGSLSDSGRCNIDAQCTKPRGKGSIARRSALRSS